jgi:hypothetical protein
MLRHHQAPYEVLTRYRGDRTRSAAHVGRHRVRSSARRRRYLAPSRSDALLSPEWRSPNRNGTSLVVTAGRERRISSSTLKPSGRSACTLIAERRTRKKPLIGSETARRRRGNTAFATIEEPRKRATRNGENSPTSPRSQYRLATTTSAFESRASARSASSTSGGCWRARSINRARYAVAASTSQNGCPDSDAPVRHPVTRRSRFPEPTRMHGHRVWS